MVLLWCRGGAVVVLWWCCGDEVVLSGREGCCGEVVLCGGVVVDSCCGGVVLCGVVWCGVYVLYQTMLFVRGSLCSSIYCC